MIEAIIEALSRFADLLFFKIISPLFASLGQLLDLVILGPMRIVHAPVALQIIVVAVLAALFSLLLRRLVGVEAKEQAFRQTFVAQRAQRDELHQIEDWKIREQLTKTMDNEIDEEFNTYLAGRFARYGMVYLLPLFLLLFWLDNSVGTQISVTVPGLFEEEKQLPSLVVFLISYLASLMVFFQIRKRLR